MSKKNLAAYISKIVYLTEEQMTFVLQHFKPFSFKKNQLLVHIGEVNQFMNFVEKGCVRFYFLKEDGLEVTRHIVFEQQFGTGLASFITGKPSEEALQVMEDSVLLRISRKDFYYLLEMIPAWEKFYRDYLEYAYTNNLNIFQRGATKDAGERYKELLRINPQIIKRLPNKVVASYLNMSPETLSRLKSKH
ncbi:Crp/Fnr family transcriptional regulator [Mucilaginibacter robiniae]|uniref:Crp/Fnr family transcriptional regulator n=1 Tax=Mucilaginibacter robiniae TaxID=2728022 RepID=A0A7L5E8W7_9SPHI|nr:Crp/Fnr family transcriptional regulator [Mucilaginibacter robiniae]QJD97323.1 Crp/Fnr family transcriptional regulator [Mucilaginibacter robiniae]